MKFFLSVFCIAILSTTAFAQRYAVASGNWNDAIWASIPGGGVGSAPIPTSVDNVFTNGFQVTVNSDVSCNNLNIRSNISNSLFIEEFSFATVFVNGQLASVNSAGNPAVPTASDILTMGEFETITFLGVGQKIGSWFYVCPLTNVTFNPGALNTATIQTGFRSTTGVITVQSGTLSINSSSLSRQIRGANSTLQINSGATLITASAINGGDGAMPAVDAPSTFFSTINVDGTLIASNYVNSVSFSISGLGLFETSYAGVNQAEGWWYQSNRPVAGTLNSLSTVTFNSGVNQSVYARSYGNLFLDNTGTKTLVGSGSLNIAGSLTINSASIIFNSNSAAAINIGGSLVNNGTWTPTDLVVFNGATSQTFPGTGLVTFSGGFQVNKSAGTLTLNRDVTTTGFSVSSSNTLNLASYTVTLAGGDINNSGTIVPVSSTILINGVSLVSGSSTTSLNNLTISGTGNFTAPSGNLNLEGDFSNSGTFVNGNGTIIFNDPSGADQVINGSSVTDFRNLTISNPIGWVNVESNQTLRGVLTLSANSHFDADGTASNGTFTILSNADDPTQDGAIAAIPVTATLNGNVTVQRFMTLEGNDGSGPNRIYRYISSPVTGATVADLQTEIQVTGTFTGASSCGGCSSSSQSMFRYNESLLGSIANGYEDFPANANTETFTPGRGYSLYVRGNLLTGSAKFDLRGTVTRGNQDLGVTYTSSGVPTDDGWNLVGNPYASTIDWEAAVGWTKTNVGTSIYFRNNAAGNIAAYAPGTGSVNGGSQYIPTGQAFWVQTTAASPSLVLTENVKAPGQITSFFRAESPKDLIRITLASATASDEILIHFKADATEGFDMHADARKLKNSIFNLSSITSDQTDLAINAQPALTCGSEKSIPLKVSNIASGMYSLNFSEFESFPDYVGIMLHDKYANKTISIRENVQYAFDVTADNQSLGADRFTITFLPDASSITSAPDHCIGSKAKPFITIKNSKKGVRYLAIAQGSEVSEAVSGTGKDITLPIETSTLVPGKNGVSLMSTIEACGVSINQIVTLTLNYQIDISQTEASSICREGSSVLKAFGSPEAGFYNWYENESNVALENHEPTLTTSILTSSKTYYVAVVSPEGCEGERVPVLAEVVQYEDAVITALSSDQLQSNYAEGNTWYFNGEKISGATSSTYSPQNSGSYSLEVSFNGCSSSSSEYEFVVTSSEESLNSGISLYPNPVVDKAYIDVLNNNEDIRSIALYNSIGKMLTDVTWVMEAEKTKGTVDMKNLPSGVYILKVSTSDRLVSLKIYKK